MLVQLCRLFTNTVDRVCGYVDGRMDTTAAWRAVADHTVTGARVAVYLQTTAHRYAHCMTTIVHDAKCRPGHAHGALGVARAARALVLCV
jgi:hypothetical protein